MATATVDGRELYHEIRGETGEWVVIEHPQASAQLLPGFLNPADAR